MAPECRRELLTAATDARAAKRLLHRSRGRRRLARDGGEDRHADAGQDAV